MGVFRKHTIVVLTLGLASVAFALLAGAGGAHGQHPASVILPLEYLPANGSPAILPAAEPAPGPSAVEVIPLQQERPEATATSSLVMNRGVASVLPAAAASKRAAIRPGPVAGASPSPAAPAGMRARTVRMRVTAYCPCAICCGHATGITASGLHVSAHGGRFVATGDEGLLPMGSTVSVPGYGGGKLMPVIDRMGDGEGPRLDVYFLSHQRAREWGVKYLDVTVYTPARPGR
jgi:3D (Asp-Asp-Asp) domain-containing protein